MNDDASFASAREQMRAWKGKEVDRAAIELLRAGLRKAQDRRDYCGDYFGPDDIPEDITFEGAGIVGSAIKMLLAAGIIRESHIHLPARGILYGRRHSIRRAAHGRKVQLYELCGQALAHEFLKRHGCEYPRSAEMDLFDYAKQSTGA